MSAAVQVREARQRAGLSIRALAARAGSAPSTIWRIEQGLLDPTVSTLERIRRAADLELPDVMPTREEEVSAALGRLTASTLLRTPDPALAAARLRLRAQLADSSLSQGARPLLEEWEELLDGPLVAVVAALIERTEHAHELRSVTPFAGLHTSDERIDAIRQARRAA